MEIKGFIENSLLEWQGKLTCVLFLPYCNLRCHYCHAQHLLKPNELESLNRKDLLDYMRRQKGWLDGAVITGGEPTLYEEELIDLMRDVRDTGLDVMLETNGTQPKWVKKIIAERWVQRITMDVKAPLAPVSYEKVAGREVDVEALKTSIKTIIDSGLPHEFRTTVVPGLVGKEEVAKIAPALKGADVMALQNFEPAHCLDTALHDVMPFMPEEMDEMERLARGGAEQVLVRGRERGLVARGAQAAAE
ncbi:MAG: anaerobic ribonucleoside-triphosphate reductase activating protein [Candidatus Brocadiia bacterium]